MSVPNWWTLILLGGASFRMYRLIAMDTLLDTPRAWLVGLGVWKDGMPIPTTYRKGLAEFITCPWCLGFWITLAWWAAWQGWPHGTLVVAAPLSISAAVGLVAKLDRDE